MRSTKINFAISLVLVSAAGFLLLWSPISQAGGQGLVSRDLRVSEDPVYPDERLIEEAWPFSRLLREGQLLTPGLERINPDAGAKTNEWVVLAIMPDVLCEGFPSEVSSYFDLLERGGIGRAVTTRAVIVSHGGEHELASHVAGLFEPVDRNWVATRDAAEVLQRFDNGISPYQLVLFDPETEKLLYRVRLARRPTTSSFKQGVLGRILSLGE